MNVDSKTIETLDRFRKKRNIAGYERVGMASRQEAKEMLSLAQDLRAGVEKWLQKNHPELLRT